MEPDSYGSQVHSSRHNPLERKCCESKDNSTRSIIPLETPPKPKIPRQAEDLNHNCDVLAQISPNSNKQGSTNAPESGDCPYRHFAPGVFNITMHLKAPLLIPLAAAAGARAIQARDVEPCAQITNLVSDANQSQGASTAG